MKSVDIGYFLLIIGFVFLIISLVLNMLDIEGWRTTSTITILLNIVGAVIVFWHLNKLTRINANI